MRKILFLGTGASGGTPGIGKSKRLESSVLIKSNKNILIDVTRNFNEQANNFHDLGAILITHGHMDACGGLKQLEIWSQKHNLDSIPLYAHQKTIETIRKKFKSIKSIQFFPILEDKIFNIGSWKISAYQVPHSKDPRFPAFSWQIKGLKTFVFASDISELTKGFKKFCQGADVLIIDGATWKRKIFTHLRIDKDLPELCRWNVGKIILTQIGKSVPAHEILEKEVRKICSRAIPAYDSMELLM